MDEINTYMGKYFPPKTQKETLDIYCGFKTEERLEDTVHLRTKTLWAYNSFTPDQRVHIDGFYSLLQNQIKDIGELEWLSLEDRSKRRREEARQKMENDSK